MLVYSDTDEVSSFATAVVVNQHLQAIERSQMGFKMLMNRRLAVRLMGLEFNLNCTAIPIQRGGVVQAERSNGGRRRLHQVHALKETRTYR